MKILVRSVFERLLAPIAWCISRVRINRITFQMIDGEEFVLKKRTPISPVLIAIGNCVLFLRRVPVEVLHYRDLVDWDRQVQSAMSSVASQETSQGLLVSRRPGRPISDLIAERAIENDRIIEVLSIALRELHRLHQIAVEIGRGKDIRHLPFSHGDASVTNALFDVETSQVCWFDFDLRHDLRQPAALRHADDLRAFLFTAERCLPIEFHSEKAILTFKDAMRLAYPDEQVWQSFEEIIHSRWFAMDLFHRAQLFRL